MTTEIAMYAPVARWLRSFLESRFPRAKKIIVEPTHQTVLWRWIEYNKLGALFPEYLAYDIKIDVLGCVLHEKLQRLVFIECKITPISLKDISQLLGYSKVANPYRSIIISPAGVSAPVNRLLNQFKRYDVLEYDGSDNRIRVAKWDSRRNAIPADSIIPPGEHL